MYSWCNQQSGRLLLIYPWMGKPVRFPCWFGFRFPIWPDSRLGIRPGSRGALATERGVTLVLSEGGQILRKRGWHSAWEKGGKFRHSKCPIHPYLAVIILLFSDIRSSLSYPSGYPDQRLSASEYHLTYKLPSDLCISAIFRKLL